MRDSLWLKLLTELIKRFFPVVFQNHGMAAIQLDGVGLSEGRQSVFLRRVTPDYGSYLLQPHREYYDGEKLRILPCARPNFPRRCLPPS
jgi:hypothetical protein